jgi:hypothetical protein
MVVFFNTYFEPCNQYVICLSFIAFERCFMHDIQTAVICTHIENWTHVNHYLTAHRVWCSHLMSPLYESTRYGAQRPFKCAEQSRRGLEL